LDGFTGKSGVAKTTAFLGASEMGLGTVEGCLIGRTGFLKGIKGDLEEGIGSG